MNKNQSCTKVFADKVQIDNCLETLLVNENVFKALRNELQLIVLETVK